MFQSAKPKSAVKISLPASKSLNSRVLNTLKKTSELVGATLGPFGRHVLIERPEVGLKNFVTKDGVTVAKHIAYDDAVEQSVLEVAMDSMLRTAQEAGDGTTTATILAYSIAQKTQQLTSNNNKTPPQKVVREIGNLVPDIESLIKEYSTPIDSDNYLEQLKKVATLSANGDTEMANIVMEAFDLVGDQGNAIISEEYGESGYKVTKFNGFSIDRGYEESLQNFYSVFLNDESRSKINLENPNYLLFDGMVSDLNSIAHALELIFLHKENLNLSGNVVVFAHDFSKDFLQKIAYSNSRPESVLKIVPCLTTQSIILNSRSQFLHDIAAYTGAKVFHPMSNPINQADINDLTAGKSDAFECARFKSTIVGLPDPSSVELRVQELKSLMSKAESVYDKRDVEVRIGKLTCGVAQIKIVGPSQAEIREKKDRAEDAWMAVRSAVKYGTLPGGGFALLRLSKELHRRSQNQIDPSVAAAYNILSEAILAPVTTLYHNAGLTSEQSVKIIAEIDASGWTKTYDLQSGKMVNASDLLDSAPAVLEAIRNSISVATLLGTIGGVVVFKRDKIADNEDMKSSLDHLDAVREGEAMATAMKIDDINSN